MKFASEVSEASIGSVNITAVGKTPVVPNTPPPNDPCAGTTEAPTLLAENPDLLATRRVIQSSSASVNAHSHTSHASNTYLVVQNHIYLVTLADAHPKNHRQANACLIHTLT